MAEVFREGIPGNALKQSNLAQPNKGVFYLKSVMSAIVCLQEKGFELDFSMEHESNFRCIQTDELLEYGNAFIAEQHVFHILGKHTYILQIFGIASLGLDTKGILMTWENIT